MGCCCITYYILGIVLAAVGFILYKFMPLIKKLFLPFSSAKWDNGEPKNVVVLHCMDRGKCIPSPSPFVLKVETYLRMANIDYVIDTDVPMGPVGKTPWISYNGTHVFDSTLIIEFLNKKFDKNLNSKLNEVEKATNRAIRILTEEHGFWGLAHWRWIGGIKHCPKVMRVPSFIFPVLAFIMKRRWGGYLWAQGLGRLSESDMIRFVFEDLRNISTLLGKKKFFGGEEPCEEDAAMFGCLAQIVWAAHESPYEKLFNDELTNLKEYCIRMREKYWKDWDEIIKSYKTNF